MDRLCFLATLPLASIGQKEGGEKMQPFNHLNSRLSMIFRKYGHFHYMVNFRRTIPWHIYPEHNVYIHRVIYQHTFYQLKEYGLLGELGALALQLATAMELKPGPEATVEGCHAVAMEQIYKAAKVR